MSAAEVFDAMTMHPRMNRPRTFFPWLGLVRSPGQSKNNVLSFELSILLYRRQK
jgi:hypothetical protein